MKLRYLVYVIIVVSSIGCVEPEECVFGTFSTERIIINDTWEDDGIYFVLCSDGNVYSVTCQSEVEVGKEYDVRVFHQRFGASTIIKIMRTNE